MNIELIGTQGCFPLTWKQCGLQSVTPRRGGSWGPRVRSCEPGITQGLSSKGHKPCASSRGGLLEKEPELRDAVVIPGLENQSHRGLGQPPVQGRHS